MSEPPLRVLLVDDHEVVRGGVKALLQATEDIVVTAEASSVREAIDEADWGPAGRRGHGRETGRRQRDRGATGDPGRGLLHHHRNGVRPSRNVITAGARTFATPAGGDERPREIPELIETPVAYTARTILDVAKEEGGGLIVMGTRGSRTGIGCS